MFRAVGFFSMTFVVLLAVCMASVPAFASDSICQPVFDAMSKVLTTPAHIYTAEPSSSRPGNTTGSGELIYFGGAIYVKASGEGAAVYAVHSENDDIKSDGTVWISRKGLPLRQEMDIDVDDPSKTHHSIRYEYGNVQAPPI